MWKPEHRLTADRRSLRYHSDLSDAEWELVAPLIPPARRGGRRRSIAVHEVLNANFYVLSTGCQWKANAERLPAKSTAHCYFMLWDKDGTSNRIHDALYVAIRETARREGSPTVAIIDSQSSKAAQKGGSALDPQLFEASKKRQRSRCAEVKGRKRPILVDTLGPHHAQEPYSFNLLLLNLV